MKPMITSSAALILLTIAAGHAYAQGACTPGLTGAQLVSTLSGMYVCAKRAGGATADSWNELHQGTTAAGGPIMDYKRGPNDPVDPSKVVGSYTINTAGNTVAYNYGDAGSPYTYVVRLNATPTPGAPGFLFCNVATGELIPAIISSSPSQVFCTGP